MLQATDWAASVPMSGVREIFHAIAGRDDIFHLEIGEPDFPTPAHIIDAAVDSVRAGSGYIASAGAPDLRTAICEKVRTVNGFDVHPDQIIITQGGVQGVSMIMSALIKPGDQVLLPDPGWPNFEMLTLLHGAEPVFYRLEPSLGFTPDIDAVAKLVTDRTALIVVNSPANPTGTVFSSALVDGFVELAARNNIPMISDEVYDELIFDDGRPANAFARDPEHVIGLYSFSKSYAMTGWRVGWVVAPEWAAPTFGRMQESRISCLPTMTQAGALAAISGPQDDVAAMRQSYQDRRDLAVHILSEGGIEVGVPGGGFYLMVPLSEGADTRAAAFSLIDNNVATSPGTAYGSVTDGFLRISLASSEHDLRHGCARIVDWYKASKGGINLDDCSLPSLNWD